jgi:hypothetical protein
MFGLSTVTSSARSESLSVCLAVKQSPWNHGFIFSRSQMPTTLWLPGRGVHDNNEMAIQ